jgi:hypothetical protein
MSAACFAEAQALVHLPAAVTALHAAAAPTAAAAAVGTGLLTTKFSLAT